MTVTVTSVTLAMSPYLYLSYLLYLYFAYISYHQRGQGQEAGREGRKGVRQWSGSGGTYRSGDQMEQAHACHATIWSLAVGEVA